MIFKQEKRVLRAKILPSTIIQMIQYSVKASKHRPIYNKNLENDINDSNKLSATPLF